MFRNAKIIDSESELLPRAKHRDRLFTLIFHLKNGYLPRQTPIFKPKLNEK